MSPKVIGLALKSRSRPQWLGQAGAVSAALWASFVLTISADLGFHLLATVLATLIPAVVMWPARGKSYRFSMDTTGAATRKSVKRLRDHYNSLINLNCGEIIEMGPRIDLSPLGGVQRARVDARAEVDDSVPLSDDDFISELSEAERPCHLLVGTGGSGKSILILKLAAEFAADYLESSSKFIPLVLPLRDWSADVPLAEWTADQASYLYAIPQEITREWHSLGLVFLFLDGIDEVDSAHRGALVRQVKQWCDGNRGRAVVSSRLADGAWDQLAAELKISHVAVMRGFSHRRIVENLELALGNLTAGNVKRPYRPDVTRSARMLKEFAERDADVREQIMLGLNAASSIGRITTVDPQFSEDPALPALGIGNEYFALCEYESARAGYLAASRMKGSQLWALSLLMFAVCEFNLGNNGSARSAVEEYLSARSREAITPGESGNRVHLTTDDDRQILGAMSAGVSYDLGQVCSRSRLAPSRVSASLRRLSELGAVESPSNLATGARYRISDSFTVAGG
ncbi:hypothetical protein NN3_52470 [Nocardia neocaledoniensis NBRC 108232]|nr:hypothetical protein NN3_52470 [Nocardia neocaledoniensis NBRC 108232]